MLVDLRYHINRFLLAVKSFIQLGHSFETFLPRPPVVPQNGEPGAAITSAKGDSAVRGRSRPFPGERPDRTFRIFVRQPFVGAAGIVRHLELDPREHDFPAIIHRHLVADLDGIDLHPDPPLPIVTVSAGKNERRDSRPFQVRAYAHSLAESNAEQKAAYGELTGQISENKIACSEGRNYGDDRSARNVLIIYSEHQADSVFPKQILGSGHCSEYELNRTTKILNRYVMMI